MEYLKPCVNQFKRYANRNISGKRSDSCEAAVIVNAERPLEHNP